MMATAADVPGRHVAAMAVHVFLTDGERVRRAIENYCDGRWFDSYGWSADETR